jgi:hypothetical protein
MVSSLLPLFGGKAKIAVRCRGRWFKGSFDDCFNDYLPIAELGAPIVAVLLLYPFYRFAFCVFAPRVGERSAKWRLASRSSASSWHPVLLIASAMGCAWALWRLALYPVDSVTLPFMAFWFLFALWFAISGWYAAPSKQG